MHNKRGGSEARHLTPPLGSSLRLFKLSSPRTWGRGRCPDAFPTKYASEPPRPPPPLPADPENRGQEEGRGGNRTVTQMRLSHLD